MEKLTSEERKIINQLENRKSDRVATLKCVDCGELFELTVGRISESYHAGYIIPCRCAKCKKIKDEKFKKFEEEELEK